MIEAKFWANGYMQTGRGDEISIILRREDGKMIERVVMPADELDNLLNQLSVCKNQQRKQGTIF